MNVPSLGNAIDGIRELCGDNVAEKCSAVWGMDEEGEINGTWRDMGLKGMWYMMGTRLKKSRGLSFFKLSSFRQSCSVSFLFKTPCPS